MKQTFTSEEVAKLCKVAHNTVRRWFDSGRLRGYRVPGTQDRRIPREYLIRFLKEHGLPLGELEDEPTLVVEARPTVSVKVEVHPLTVLSCYDKEKNLWTCVRAAHSSTTFGQGITLDAAYQNLLSKE